MIFFNNQIPNQVKAQPIYTRLSSRHKRLEKQPKDNKDQESGKIISVINIVGLILIMSANSLMLREDGKNLQNATNVSPEASYLTH